MPTTSSAARNRRTGDSVGRQGETGGRLERRVVDGQQLEAGLEVAASARRWCVLDDGRPARVLAEHHITNVVVVIVVFVVIADCT